VTAYSVATVPGFLPAALESDPVVLSVRPKVEYGKVFAVGYGDTVANVTHTGASDGRVIPIVVDPTKSTGNTYRVNFNYNADSSGFEWSVTDVTAGTTKLSGQTNQLDNDNYLTVDGMQIKVLGPPNDFKSFQVVADASGALASPVPGAFAFQGFPTPGDGNPPSQTGGGAWAFHAGGSTGSYASFLSRAMRGSNFDNLIPYDWEMRFTGNSFAVRAFNDGLVVQVPFELWNVGVGTYADASDDYRLIPWILDIDDNHQWNILNEDHPGSGAANDPYTDWIYWRIPAEHTSHTPGTTGYDNYVATLNFTDSLSHTYAYDGLEVIARSVLVNWNGGTVPDPNYPAGIDQLAPETGTIFRLVSTKPNRPTDSFEFVSPPATAGVEEEKKSAEKVGVFPNPYYAFNPAETNRFARFVTFNNLPPKVKIRIFNLAGQLVRTLDKDDPTQFLRWDLTNHATFPVASGMYIAHVTLTMPSDGSEVTKVLKFAVIQEQEILNSY